MEAYKEQLWMPYQIGLEFLNNRPNTISALMKMPAKLSEVVKKGKTQLLNTFNEKDTSRHPLISKDELDKVYDDAIKPILQYLSEQEAKMSYNLKEDTILDKVMEIYNGKVSNDLTENELQTLYEEGERRYADHIPPGYKDEKEKRPKGLRHLFGDLIIWKQLMSYSKEHEKDIIFVTEDKKDDWWQDESGKKSPRKELLREFRRFTEGHTLLMYQQKGFLNESKEKVKDSTVSEVEEVREDDERIDREKTQQIFDSVQENWPLRSFAPVAYSNVDLVRHLNNPLLDILEEPKRKTTALRNPLTVSVADLLTTPEILKGLSGTQSVIDACKPASKILSQLLGDHK